MVFLVKSPYDKPSTIILSSIMLYMYISIYMFGLMLKTHITPHDIL